MYKNVSLKKTLLQLNVVNALYNCIIESAYLQKRGIIMKTYALSVLKLFFSYFIRKDDDL